MFYTVKTPWLFKKIYPSLIWEKPTNEKILFLTFDDGPHLTATPFVLQQLRQYNATATFFCIGKNVAEQPGLYQKILDEGHITGNHTFNHLNGWKTDDKTYIQNILKASNYIKSHLFRPPYGKITRLQAGLLQKLKGSRLNGNEMRDGNNLSPFTIIMWTVLSADFDEKISPERCSQNVIFNAKPGSIIVFHDSAKAWNRMSFALPKVLQHFSKEGYSFKCL
jgi:peptidoglycan/xylan/chitin deacetylase (PgdA/CDA1 family)